MKRILVLLLSLYILFSLMACGNKDGSELEHDYIAATCTNPQTCKTCGVTEGQALGHNFNEATCTNPLTCMACGVTEGQALGHNFNEATCTNPLTCVACGITEGEPLGHNFEKATCTNPQTCKTCGIAEGQALGHNFEKATCTNPQTCKTCGIAEGQALGHNFEKATCTNPQTCKTCGIAEGEALGHNFNEATCTNPQTCKTCGIAEGQALGHNFNEATCTNPQTCKTCGIAEGEALGHNFNDATCTNPQTCKTCGITQPAPGHNYTPATCTNPQTCTVCGATEGDALGHKYVLGECKNCNDYSSTYCPKLYFTGDMSEMTSKKDVRDISFEYRSKQQNVAGAAKIKVQGSSSLAYDKKNYTIDFYKSSNYNEKLEVNVGWGEQNRYCLKANWIDKTHTRNVVTAKLVGEIQKKYGLFSNAPNNGAVDGFPVEIYINGSFHGLYTMNIPKEDWMFDMDSNNPNHIVIGGEDWTAPVLFKEIPTDFEDWAVEIGPENDETLTKIQRLIAFVRDSSDEEFKANFNKYLNLDATLNYYVMYNYCFLPDNLGKNTLLATYDGNVWYPCLYDLDTSWGTDWNGDELYEYGKYLMSTSGNLLWERMENLYKKEIATRYFELRSTILDTSHVMEVFNSFYNSIPKEVLDRETAKWTEETGGPIPGYPISQIQEYLDSVIPRLDDKYNSWK